MNKLNKMIASTAAVLVAVTSLTAPAKADINGGELAAILLGGAVIYSIAKDRKDDRRRAIIEAEKENGGFVHSHGNFGRHFHKYGVNHDNAHRFKQPVVRNLPLPDQCKRRVTVKNKTKDAYRAKCLRRAGYDIANNGTVRHDRWLGRTARPILIYR